MAPQPRDKTAPDGAPPGTEARIAAAGRHAFDADGRAKAREEAPVTIGGETFHRRRKNWEATRALRGLLRDQERAGVRSDRARKKIDALPADAADSEVERLDQEVEDATVASDEAAYKIIALLLRDEKGESPPLEHLKEELDVEDAGALAGTLAGGGEPPADPTETLTS